MEKTIPTVGKCWDFLKLGYLFGPYSKEIKYFEVYIRVPLFRETTM